MCRWRGSCRPRSSTPWPCWPGRSVLSRWPADRLCVPVITRTRWYTPMPRNIILPELGAAPVWLSVWFADLGDAVYEGDRLVEVLVGGATFDVSAPASGWL